MPVPFPTSGLKPVTAKGTKPLACPLVEVDTHRPGPLLSAIAASPEPVVAEPSKELRRVADFTDSKRRPSERTTRILRHLHPNAEPPLTKSIPGEVQTWRIRLVADPCNKLPKQRVVDEHARDKLAGLVIGYGIAVEIVCQVELPNDPGQPPLKQLRHHPGLAQGHSVCPVRVLEGSRVRVKTRYRAGKRIGTVAPDRFHICEKERVKGRTCSQQDIERSLAAEPIRAGSSRLLYDTSSTDTDGHPPTRLFFQPRFDYLRECLAPCELDLAVLLTRDDRSLVVGTSPSLRHRGKNVASLTDPFAHPLDLFRRLDRHHLPA